MLFREKRLGVRKACEIVLQVAEALHYIHRQNVVHCDIKTENILIGEEEGDGKRRKMVVEAARLRARALARRVARVDVAVGHAALRRARAHPRRARVAGERRLRRRHPAVRAAHRRRCRGTARCRRSSPATSTRCRSRRRSSSTAARSRRSRTLILHALAKRPAERHKDMAAFIYELRTVMDMLGFGAAARRPAARAARRDRADSRQSERDELARARVRRAAGCRSRCSRRPGMIVAANPAFAKFVMGVAVEVEGLPVKSTPLATAWATSEQDHRAHARRQSGPPHHRDRRRRRRGRAGCCCGSMPCRHDHVVLGVQPLEL